MFEPDASAAGSTASQESLWPESTYEWMTERTSNNVVLRARIFRTSKEQVNAQESVT